VRVTDIPAEMLDHARFGALWPRRM